MNRMKQKAIAAMVTVSAVLGAGGVAMAQTAPAPLNFTAITAAIDASTIVTALTAIAAVKILPGVAKWGFNKVIGWFR